MIWVNAPEETDPRYFQTWQRVSLALQKGLRTWIPAAYFREDVARYEDRDTSYQLVVYEACRTFHGRPRTEFTYDVADPGTLPAALRTIGQAMRTVLDPIGPRLYEAGRPELARRYAPVWHQDILRAVRKKPKRLIRLLASESALIDAAIDWGTMRNAAAEKRFLKVLTSLARVQGTDVQELREHVLNCVENVLNARVLEHGNAVAARSPNARIG